MDEVESSFRDAAAQRGLVLPARLDADGTLHRCGTVDKPHGKDGAYLLHLDGVAAGGLENHADGAGWVNWCSKAEGGMSALELAEHRARVAAGKKARDEELARARAAAAEKAAKTWSAGKPAPATHPYLAKKKVKPHGARVVGDKLVLTVSDAAGVVHSLQTIDAAGGKMFLTGGKKHGCFYAIGNLAKAAVILVAEGFATAATCAEASGLPAVAAFDCGNLRPVAEAIARQYPRAKLVICADDDAKTDGNPGVTKARDAADATGAKLAIPKFGPGRAGQTDFNDLAALRGVSEVKRQLAAFMGSTFESASSRLTDERAERIADARHIVRFGVKFLDDSMGGITRSDLVLVGAKYGKGKTALATIIAKVNASMGKRVHYFALEAEDREIERRMKYQIVSGLYYAEPGGHRPIRYQDWRNGLLDDELGGYEDQADAELALVTKNLHTLYKDEDYFTGDDFAKKFDEIQDETDLVVLDHFHYVDSDDRDDLRAMKRNAMMIRRAALRAKKPVVAVAHIRKQDHKTDPLVPSGEAFRGSSDLINIATKAIMIAPDYDTDTGDPALWATFMQAAKCRTDSSLERYVARMVFDVRNDQYRAEYTLGRLVAGGKKFVEVEHNKIPAWSSSPRGLAVDTINLGEAAE